MSIDSLTLSGYLDNMTELSRTAKTPLSRYLASSIWRGTAADPAVDLDSVVHSAPEALGALGDIERTMRSLEFAKIRLIGAAQRHGASWDEIGSAMAVSRQAAWEKYRDRVRDLLDVTAARAGNSEEESLESAATVLREVRGRRSGR